MLAQEIQELVDNGNMVRVYFKQYDKSIAYGKFVACSDHADLVKKGMVRFISEGRIEAFDSSHDCVKSLQTKIHNIDGIKYVTKFS